MSLALETLEMIFDPEQHRDMIGLAGQDRRRRIEPWMIHGPAKLMPDAGCKEFHLERPRPWTAMAQPFPEAEPESLGA